MFDNTFNKSKENIDNENNLHLNNNNRFPKSISKKSNLPTNIGNVLPNANRFVGNINNFVPNQLSRNSNTPVVNNGFQDIRINRSAFPNGNAIPTNLNRNNLNPNNVNAQQNPNNFNGQPRFNPNNLNHNNINNFHPNINQHYLNQNPNNFNGQPRFNPNNLNPNNINNFHPNINQHYLNQNPNNFNGQPNSNLNQNQKNINGQQNVNPNNLIQNQNNFNNQQNINGSNSNNTPINDVTSEKDTNLNNTSITNTDISLNKEPLEIDEAKTTYNHRSKKRITFITLTSMLGTGALVATIAVPIALIGPNAQNTTQPITTRIAYDLETKNVKVVVESNKLPHNIRSYSVFREMPDKIFEPIPQNDITLLPVGNSEINLDFIDADLTVYSIYKVKINDGSTNGIEVISIPDENIKMPKISIVSQPQSQILLTSTSINTTTLSVGANVTINPIANQEISYQWKSSNTNSTNEADWMPIVNETKSTFTYDTTDIAIGVKKYFKCIVGYKYANPVTSTIIYIEKVDNQPVITITTHPEITKTLTSASTNFSLVANASVINEVSGQQVSYQWQSSSSENGTYENIDGATSATYNYELDVNTKNSWRDTWYKCNVTYPGATLAETSSSLVKMTLTEAEAKTELLKWLAVDANAISVLTAYFNEPIETSVKNTFYKSLHEHHLLGGNPTLVVHSIEPMQITANNNYPTSYKSYKIKLKTTSPANIELKSIGASTRTTYQAGMIIEFNTLFSFGDEIVEILNTDNTKYNMILSPTFTTYNNKPTTTLLWTSDTTNGAVAPTTSNPYKKGAYPVRFYTNSTSTSPIIDDSVFLPSRLIKVYTSGLKSSYLYTMIPTYHIRTTNQ